MMASHEGVRTTYKTPRGTKRARVNGLKHAVFLPVDTSNPFGCRIAPRQKDDSIVAHPSNDVNGLLGKAFPAFARVTICLMCTNRQAGIEQQHTAFSPRD